MEGPLAWTMAAPQEVPVLDLSLSWPQFLVIAVANFFLSWIYYSPAVPWFKAWAADVGMDISKKEMTEEEKRRMPSLMGGAVLASLLVSYGFQVLVRALGATSALGGAGLGAFLWLVFAVTLSLNSRFEGRKDRVLLINNVLYLATYAGFGAVLAVWR